MIDWRLNKKSVLGGGLNCKLGMGEGWNSIRLTHEGIGLRTFVKWKIKTGWALAGGYEWNRQNGFMNYWNLFVQPGWQKSGTLDVTKTFRAGKKLNGEFQILYDLLNKTGTGLPLVFRFGYSHKK